MARGCGRARSIPCRWSSSSRGGPSCVPAGHDAGMGTSARFEGARHLGRHWWDHGSTPAPCRRSRTLVALVEDRQEEGERCHNASASRSSLKFSVAVSNCLLVSRITTGSASLKKPRLSPRNVDVRRVPPSTASKVLSISR